MNTIVRDVLLRIWSPLERRLDQTAMYRTVTYALSFLAAVAAGLGFFGIVPYSPFDQIISLTVALSSGLLVNWLCSILWRVSVNMESAVITALILHFLIIPAPLTALQDSWVIASVVVLAILSKYIFAWRKQHVVNPAAAGLVLLALAYMVFDLPGYFESTWWIGRPELFVPLVLAGAAVVLKVRKWVPVISFLTIAFIVFLIEEHRFAGEISTVAVGNFWFSGSSLFLAFFMLTEPFMMPPTKRLQVVYGASVGVISQTTLFLSVGLKMTPELALMIGNLLFYPATLRQKLIVSLVAMREVAKDTMEFRFTKPVGLRFKAGQYLEWMLPHAGADDRGIRRYFTIASAPHDSELAFTVRFAPQVSSYKTALHAMKPGGMIVASQLAGDFTLPERVGEKVAFIAGGIGITPFISHISHLTQETAPTIDAVLFYCNNTVAEIAYRDRLQAATTTLPLRVVHILAKEEVSGLEHGFLTEDIIRRHTPDFLERTWYISGPPGMVNAYTKLLLAMDIPRRRIKRDFFPGLA